MLDTGHRGKSCRAHRLLPPSDLTMHEGSTTYQRHISGPVAPCRSSTAAKQTGLRHIGRRPSQSVPYCRLLCRLHHVAGNLALLWQPRQHAISRHSRPSRDAPPACTTDKTWENGTPRVRDQSPCGHGLVLTQASGAQHVLRANESSAASACATTRNPAAISGPRPGFDRRQRLSVAIEQPILA